MTLLIDGYNLLNSVGITGRGPGAGSLARSRNALLNFLAESLTPDEVGGTTVVFDAAGAPPGLPRTVEHRGICVRFSKGYPDADALIEELVQADSAPKRMTVVSSDHALQRAARRRKARAVDSDVWFHELLARRARRETSPPASARPQLPLSEHEVAHWLEEFGGQERLEGLIVGEPLEDDLDSRLHDSPSRTAAPAADKLTADEAARIGNPFPPGYGEDLLEEGEADDRLNPFPPGFGDEAAP
jgi:hypothetical protein